MRKKTNIWARAAMTLLFAMLTSMTVQAQEQQVTVWLSDGTTSVVSFSTMPEFTYADGYVKMKNTETEQSWLIENLSKLTFSKKGDVNEDGAVNQKDRQEVKDYIMGSPSAMDDKSKLDVNGDNLVNVADIVEITNIIQSVASSSAQSIIIEDKNDNHTIYNSEKVTSLDFQQSPAGFTVRLSDTDTFYSFDGVQVIKCLPEYLFVDPQVVHVSLASADGNDAVFAAKVTTNVEYDVETSDPWITVARKEADRLVCNVSKHEGNDRKGYIALASKDGLVTDTIKVSLDDEYFVLKCLTPVQSITTVGTAQFMLVEIVNGALRPAAGKTISFSAENGTCSVKEAVTDAQGIVSVDYTPSSDADRGSVQACFRGYFNGISMMYTSTALFAMEKYELKALEPKKYLWEEEDAVEVEFQLMEYDKGTWNPVRATDVYFACENGLGDDISKKTDEEGKVSVIFKPDQDFKEGSVTARCIIQLIDKSPWEGYATTKLVRAEAYSLEALTPEIHLCGDNFGEIPVQFRLLKFDHENTTWIPCGDKTIKFTAVNGVAGSTSAVSDVDGIVTVTFKPDQGITEGSLTASCDIDLPEGNKWRGEAVTKFMTDLYKIERILPWNADAVDYYIGKPWDCEFQLLKKEGNDYVPCPYQYIQFEATNGSCTPDYALTDTEGKVRNTYTMDDDKDNGSLKASFSFTDAEGNVCIGSVITNFFLDKYDLKCLTPEVEVNQSETVDIRYQLLEYKKGNWEPCPDKTITFTAKNGICTPEWTKTNAEGIATVGFSPTSTDVTEGVVQAECGITLDPKTGLEWRAAELALVTIIENYKLECLTKEVEIKKGETADIRFRLMELEDGKWVTCSGAVYFTAENGTSNPEWMQADDDGLTHATFIPAADATEGTLTGSISIDINDEARITWSDAAHITIIDVSDRPSKEKAKPKIRVWDSGEGGSKPQVVDDNGNGEIVFVVEERIEGEDADRPVEGAKVEFETDNQDDNLEGFSWATTNKDGKAPAKFKIKDFAKFKGIEIKAKTTVKYSDGETPVEMTVKVNSDGTLDTGGGGGTPCDTGDEQLNKADLMDNSYVIKNKKTGEEQVRDYAPKWSEWRKDGKDFIMFQLEDADAEGMTLGDAWGNLPWNIVNVVTALTGQSFENSPGGKFGWGVYTKDCNLNAFFDAHTGESGMASDGNLKPESKILLRKPCNTKKEASSRRRAPGEEEEYTGEYELLFYLVFENEEGDEYEVYGKGTMKKHVPTITSFQVQAEKDWVKVGESTKVKLDGYYEEEATWDWDDVELKAQATNYEDARNGVDDGFFTWDAATQTLTSVKSNNNKNVYVRLGLKSKPGVQSTLTVATGEGWKYTTITPSKNEVTYTGYGYMQFSFDWTPKDSDDEKFDYNSIEIDPETNPNGYFSIPGTYASQGWPLYVNNDTPAGEYTVRFWLKSNHDVSCTVKVIAYPEEE